MNYYYLKLFDCSTFPKETRNAYGIDQNIKALTDLKHYIHKAKKNNYKKVKIPVTKKSIDKIALLLKLLTHEKIQLVIQVALEDLEFDQIVEIRSLPELEIEITLANSDERMLKIKKELIQRLTEMHPNTYLTIIIHRYLDIKKVIAEKFRLPIYYYFSTNYNEKEYFLNCNEIHNFIKKTKKSYPDLIVKRPPGNILWDQRISVNLELVPDYAPVISSKVGIRSDLLFSIIIPCYNNRDYLPLVINQLLNQNRSPQHYEIIIVDDGSQDGTYENILNELKSKKGEFNYQYYYLPRVESRTMGDARYRAGIARNFALTCATGEILCFLDSDIIVYPNYLNEIEKGLQKYDLLQSVRLDLSKQISKKLKWYTNINEKTDLAKQDPYWKEFNKTLSWDEKSDKWKYLCTHSLCLKKSTFIQYGHFEKNFIYYGFEDTDLGYHMAKKGCRFGLLKKPVYHLFHETTRSEFYNSMALRKSLLSKTAQIFYLLNLDEDIYLEFKSLMRTRFSIIKTITNLYRSR